MDRHAHPHRISILEHHRAEFISSAEIDFIVNCLYWREPAPDTIDKDKLIEKILKTGIPENKWVNGRWVSGRWLISDAAVKENLYFTPKGDDDNDLEHKD